jgi:hypothetical protein
MIIVNQGTEEQRKKRVLQRSTMLHRVMWRLDTVSEDRVASIFNVEGKGKGKGEVAHAFF